jgi:hypothetical protein
MTAYISLAGGYLSYPELYSDERVVLQAQNVKVKSVVFEVVLTTRRLVLIDSKKNSIPPQEINLATLKDVELGENAIRDPTITISIITISGNTRQMVLTFSKTSGGERRRECDEWVRALRQNITSTVYHPVTQGPAPREIEPAPVAQPPAAQPPAPAPAPHRIEVTNPPPPKKRIEIARPMKKIVEAAPAMPVPVETSSLPSGFFCNRCGSRVPPESAFCNRCGTPVIRDTETATREQEDTGVTWEQYTPPAVPQVQVHPSPVFPTISDKKDRPIEQVIHSIEPLIEDSVPRTVTAPLVPAKQVHMAHPADIAEPADQVPAAGADSVTPDAAAQSGDVKWPVLTPSGTSVPGTSPTVPAAAPAMISQPPPSPPPRSFPVKMIAVLAFIVLVVIAGVYVFTQNPAGTPGVTPTPAITIPATTVPTATVATIKTTIVPATTPQQVTPPSAVVPTSGVFVKVTTTGKYSGSVGTPGRLREISDSEGPFYQISTSDGPVVVNLQKSDGTSAVLAVDVYKDGALMKHVQTSAPKGQIEFQALLAAAAPPTTAAP